MNIVEINLNDDKKVYMSFTEYQKESLVLVDTKKFLELWKKDNKHTDLSHGDAKVWESDYKYSEAADGFSHGLENPVPLANVSIESFIKSTPIYTRVFFFFKNIAYYQKEKVEYLAIGNGITRTIWLLNNGAKCFPVLDYNITSRDRLKELAECKDMQYIDKHFKEE